MSLQNAAAAAAAQTHLHALIRSASTSPFLVSPQNSFTNLQAASAVAAAAQTSPIPSLHQLALNDNGEKKSSEKSRSSMAEASNVVSSTMEDEDSKDSTKYTSLEPAVVRSNNSSNSTKPTSSCSPRTSHLPDTASAMAASGQHHVKDEPDGDFVETHCYWTDCDREFYTQNQLVKVNLGLLRTFAR